MENNIFTLKWITSHIFLHIILILSAYLHISLYMWWLFGMGQKSVEWTLSCSFSIMLHYTVKQNQTSKLWVESQQMFSRLNTCGETWGHILLPELKRTNLLSGCIQTSQFPLWIFRFLESSGGDSYLGIREEHVSRAEEDRSLSSALWVAQKAVHWGCPRPGWHLLHTHAGKGGEKAEWINWSWKDGYYMCMKKTVSQRRIFS